MFNYNNRDHAGKVATGSEQHVTANEASKTVTGPKVSASTEGERTLFYRVHPFCRVAQLIECQKFIATLCQCRKC